MKLGTPSDVDETHGFDESRCDFFGIIVVLFFRCLLLGFVVCLADRLARSSGLPL